MGKAPEEWSFGDLEAGFKNAALVLDETLRRAVHGPPPDGNAQRDGLLAERQAVPARLHAERARSRAAGIARLGRHPAVGRRAHLRVHGRRLRQQGRGRGVDGDSGAAVEEGQRAGDDAHQPRGGELHRPRAHQHDRPREGRLRQGRPHHGARPLHRPGHGRLRADGRSSDPAATPPR